MLTDHLYLTVSVHKRKEGGYLANLWRVETPEVHELLDRTGYSSASLCFEELSSLIDGILFHWFGMPPSYETHGATG
jgi:hypothetical protein